MNIIKNEIEDEIVMIWETKIDNSFPISQFTMTVIGGILFFFREDIPCKMIKTDCDADFEGIFMEINLRKKN